MPIYTYRCEGCGETFDKRQSFSDDALTSHETCGGSLRKVLHPVGIVFKGSGFYNTDYKNGGAAAKTDDAAKADAAGKSDDGDKTEAAAASSKDNSSKDNSSGSDSKSEAASTSTTPSTSGPTSSAGTPKSEPTRSTSTG